MFKQMSGSIYLIISCCFVFFSIHPPSLRPPGLDAADKYGVVSLKLEAEAAYVESTKITVDNAMDNLLYADAKNCALLKEAVIDFLTDNGREVKCDLGNNTSSIVG
jgi:hypothetical protein